LCFCLIGSLCTLPRIFFTQISCPSKFLKMGVANRFVICPPPMFTPVPVPFFFGVVGGRCSLLVSFSLCVSLILSYVWVFFFFFFCVLHYASLSRCNANLFPVLSGCYFPLIPPPFFFSATPPPNFFPRLGSPPP